MTTARTSKSVSSTLQSAPEVSADKTSAVIPSALSPDGLTVYPKCPVSDPRPIICSFAQANLPLVSLTRDIAIQSGNGRIFYHRTERNRDGTALRCRVTGKCKVWKTRPHDYRLPVKHGLKNSFYLTHRNSDVWLLTDPTGIQGELPVERRKAQVQGYGYYGLDRRSGK